MTTNSIAVSRNLVATGLELKAANAIAEKVVTHADETLATKTDLAKLEGEIKLLATRMNTKFESLEASLKDQRNMMFGMIIG